MEGGWGVFTWGGPGTNQTLILKTAVFEKQRWTVPKPSPNPRRKAPRQLLLSHPAGGQDPRAAFGGFGFPVEGVETVLPVTGSGHEPEKTLWDGAGALPWPGWEPGSSGWDTPYVWEWQSRFPELTLIFVSPLSPPPCLHAAAGGRPRWKTSCRRSSTPARRTITPRSKFSWQLLPASCQNS